MSDARLAYDPIAMSFDLAFVDYGLDIDDGLETAVIISLFTDRRADTDDALPSTGERRGWWADAYPAIAGDRIGSRLWLLAREKQTQSALNRAREYAQEALQWLIDDGIARSVTTSAEIVRDGVLGISVEIARSNQPVAQYRFENFWGTA